MTFWWVGVALAALAQAPDAGSAIEDFVDAAPADAGTAGGIEAFNEAPPQPQTRVFGAVKSQLGINVRPDAQSDPSDALARNLFEGLVRANLGVDVKLSSSWRLYLEGRLWWRGTTLPDFQRAKASVEPYLGEAFLDYYSPAVDIRFGNQVVSFGANPLFAPADQLNPRDLRYSFLQSQPEDVKLPAPAIRASGEYGRVSWAAAYFPFFIPDRYDVFGTNEALIQPGFGVAVPERVSSSISDQLQPHVLESQRPNAWPWLGDLGLRATTVQGRVKLGLSWVWMNEKLPEVTIDPELAGLLAAQAQGQAVDPAAALSVENRLIAGQTLFTGQYQRQHVLSAEASTLIGPAQLDLDLAYSPAQTFIDQTLNPVRKSSVTWVVGVSQAKESPWVYAFTYVGLLVPDVDANQLLLVIEPATARGAARAAILHVLTGSLSYWPHERVELSVRGAFEPIQLSGAVGPRVAYKVGERVHLWAGAEFYQGKALSPFGYYNRANQVLVGADIDAW